MKFDRFGQSHSNTRVNSFNDSSTFFVQVLRFNLRHWLPIFCGCFWSNICLKNAKILQLTLFNLQLTVTYHGSNSIRKPTTSSMIMLFNVNTVSWYNDWLKIVHDNEEKWVWRRSVNNCTSFGLQLTGYPLRKVNYLKSYQYSLWNSSVVDWKLGWFNPAFVFRGQFVWPPKEDVFIGSFGFFLLIWFLIPKPKTMQKTKQITQAGIKPLDARS